MAVRFPLPTTVGKMIGDQLAETGRRWKSYQESLPAAGADGVDYSDGYFTDLSTISRLSAAARTPSSNYMPRSTTHLCI